MCHVACGMRHAAWRICVWRINFRSTRASAKSAKIFSCSVKQNKNEAKKKGRGSNSQGGVAKYAAYVLSGKRFSAPEAANETKQRYPVPSRSISLTLSLSLSHSLPLSVKSSHGVFCHAFVNFINQFVSKHKLPKLCLLAISMYIASLTLIFHDFCLHFFQVLLAALPKIFPQNIYLFIPFSFFSLSANCILCGVAR